MSNKNANDLLSLAAVFHGLGELFGERVEVHQVELFCVAAAHALNGEPLDSRELAEKLKLSTSAVSRNIAWLSDRGRLTKEGMSLITMKVDPRDYRRKPLALTSKGERAVSKLVHIAEDFK